MLRPGQGVNLVSRGGGGLPMGMLVIIPGKYKEIPDTTFTAMHVNRSWLL